jgi:hypothetical protein
VPHEQADVSKGVQRKQCAAQQFAEAQAPRAPARSRGGTRARRKHLVGKRDYAAHMKRARDTKRLIGKAGRITAKVARAKSHHELIRGLNGAVRYAKRSAAAKKRDGQEKPRGLLAWSLAVKATREKLVPRAALKRAAAGWLATGHGFL